MPENESVYYAAAWWARYVHWRDYRLSAGEREIAVELYAAEGIALGCYMRHALAVSDAVDAAWLQGWERGRIGQSACRQCGASIQLCHAGKVAACYGLPCCHRCDHIDPHAGHGPVLSLALEHNAEAIDAMRRGEPADFGAVDTDPERRRRDG